MDNFNGKPEYLFDVDNNTGIDTTIDEFVRTQILGLLDIVVFTIDGQPVTPNGFVYHEDAFVGADQTINKVHPILKNRSNKSI